MVSNIVRNFESLSSRCGDVFLFFFVAAPKLTPLLCVRVLRGEVQHRKGVKLPTRTSFLIHPLNIVLTSKRIALCVRPPKRKLVIPAGKIQNLLILNSPAQTQPCDSGYLSQRCSMGAALRKLFLMALG